MKMKFFGYSFLEFGIKGIEIFLKLYLLFFYTEKMGLEIYYVSLVLGIVTLIDILASPVLGLYIDKYKFKFMQRYYLIGFGLAGTCLFLFALLNPPGFEKEIYDLAYLLIVYLCFNIFNSLMSISYSSSIGDITKSHEERGKMLGWKNIFGSLGSIIAIGVPGGFLIYDPSNAFYYSSSAFIFILVACFLITQPTIKKHNIKSIEHKKTQITFETIYKRFRESFMVIYLMVLFIINLATNLSGFLGVYFYKYDIQFDEFEIQILMSATLFISVVLFPVFYYKFKNKDKISKLPYMLLSLGVVNSLLVMALPQKKIAIAILVFGVLGALLFAIEYFLEVIFLEYVKNKEEQTHQDKMGFYYSLWNMTNKVAIFCSLLVFGVITQTIVNSGYGQEGSSFSILTYFMGPVVGFIYIIAGSFFFLLPRKWNSLFKN